MKILLQNRSTYLTSLAGDSIQLMKTKEYLIKLGVDARIDCNHNISLDGYDVVHLFNLVPIEDTLKFFENAVRQQKRIVLSPIYWDPQEYLKSSNQMDRFAEWWRQTNPLRKIVLDGTRMIFPSSILEFRELQKSFSRTPPAHIVPNAADQSFLNANPDNFRKKRGSEPFVLSVGRICRHKNQYHLIQAMERLKIPLVCIGPINDGQYYQVCRRAAAGLRVKFIPEMTPGDLKSAYAAARVHALVSWYDIPGLVSLEAALAGCSIVSTDRGSASEYLGDDAFYCNPGDIRDIGTKIRMAWETPPRLELREKISRNFTWDITAAKTLEGYQRVLDHDFSPL